MKLNPIASEARAKKQFPARAVGFCGLCRNGRMSNLSTPGTPKSPERWMQQR